MKPELAALAKRFQEFLHLPEPGALFVALGTLVANRLPGDPVWLLLIAPPSSGKTELLRPLEGLQKVHFVSDLTEAGLLSGVAKSDHEEGATGGLLKTIGEFGVIVCKDFTSVLSMHRDKRAAVLAALREIYDGKWVRVLGSGGGRVFEWEGKVGLLGACTEQIEQHHGVMASMGERFALYRLPKVDPAKVAARALQRDKRLDAKRNELGEAVRTFLKDNIDWENAPNLSDATRSKLIHLSEFVATARSTVDRDGKGREIEFIPQPEGPARVAGVLAQLHCGLQTIGLEEDVAWSLTRKVGLDCLPAVRWQIIDAVRAKPQGGTVGELAEATKLGETTTRRRLQDLGAHGVLEVRRAGGKELWWLSGWARDKLGLIGLSETSGAQAGASEVSGDTRAVPENVG